MTVPAGRGTSTSAPRQSARPPVRLIGLTGGIATGKSTVAGLLRGRGAVVVDSDRLAREVVEPGSPALAEIAAAFGPTVITTEGWLDRSALGAIVFGDPGARARLEAITHPRIGELSAARVAAALATEAPLVVCDIPLLFEGGREGMFEGVMVVWCDPATERARLRARDGLDEAAAAARLAAQLPVDEKRRMATWVIDNSGPPEDCARQVAQWWRDWVDGAQRATSPS